jgi:hypothetical protein
MGYKFQIDASFVAAFLLALGGISVCRERPYSGAVKVSLGLPRRWIFASGRRVSKKQKWSNPVEAFSVVQRAGLFSLQSSIASLVLSA